MIEKKGSKKSPVTWTKFVLKNCKQSTVGKISLQKIIRYKKKKKLLFSFVKKFIYYHKLYLSTILISGIYTQTSSIMR